MVRQLVRGMRVPGVLPEGPVPSLPRGGKWAEMATEEEVAQAIGCEGLNIDIATGTRNGDIF